MRIVDLLNKESILLNASPASKQEAIDMLVDLQVILKKIHKNMHMPVMA